MAKVKVARKTEEAKVTESRWKKIDTHEDLVNTFAMDVPNGCIVRIDGISFCGAAMCYVPRVSVKDLV